MTGEEKSIDYVAWYGAIVATLGFALSLYAIFRDRAKIDIKYEPNMYLAGNGAAVFYKQSDKMHLSISAINKGRRPIRIDRAALRIFGHYNKNFLLTDSFANHRNKIINEENPKTTFMVVQDLIDLKNVIYVVVTDGTGRQYRKYIKKFPTIYLIIDWLKNKFSKNENN